MADKNTRLVILGSGNPNPDPDRKGSAVLILVGEVPYLVDFGAGVIRQAAALTAEYGGPLENFRIADLRTAFLTHLHSDHTLGFPDLILTPWIMGRSRPLNVYGPTGLSVLREKLLEGYREDIHYRVFGTEPTNDLGWRVNAVEFDEGLVYKDQNITVEAFSVRHGTWPNAFGFRFTTPDKVLVISGDTAPCENIQEFSQGADILIHEVYSQAGFESKSKAWQTYHASHHTSTSELAELARKTNPDLLILYHVLFWGHTEEEILSEIKVSYPGRVIVGADLQIFD